jgi:hypothetical protein
MIFIERKLVLISCPAQSGSINFIFRISAERIFVTPYLQGVAEHYQMPLLLELVNWMFEQNPQLASQLRVNL